MTNQPSPFPNPDSPARRPPLRRETAEAFSFDAEPPPINWIAEFARFLACVAAGIAIVMACVLWTAR
jgi:hypothetical protein